MVDTNPEHPEIPAQAGHTGGIQSVRWHLILAGLSAVLIGLIFPPISWSWLVYFCLAPLGILAARSAKRRRLAWTVWLVFLIWWLVMIRWMIPVTVGGYIALAGFMALFLMLFALCVNQIKRKFKAAPMTFILPAVWVSLEFIKAIFPFGGFNWFALSSATANYLPAQSAGHIVQIADLFGQYTVGFVVAMSSGFIVDFFTLPLLRRVQVEKEQGNNENYPVFKTKPRKTISLCFVLWLVIFLASYFYGGYRIAQFNKVTSPALNVAVIQTNINQSNKMSPSEAQQSKNWNHLLNLIKKAGSSTPKPDLIAWPETMTPAPLNDSAQNIFALAGSDWEKYRQQIESLSRTMGIYILAGAPTMTDWKLTTAPNGVERYQSQKRYNSAYLFNTKGELVKRYDKVHLVPFGEYIPIVGSYPSLKHWFIHTLSPYGFDYTTDAGTQLKVFHIKLKRHNSKHTSYIIHHTSFATPICFEDTVPRLCRDMIYGVSDKKQSNMLINITNDGWFFGTNEPTQHAQIAALRCIENRVPMARSVNTAMSGFIDSIGRVHSLVTVNGKHAGVSGIATHTMRKDSRITLYSKVGQLPVIVLTILILILFIVCTVPTKNLKED